MDLKQLSALIAVAESGSVTRAAELLHLVQPAVSRQIRGLEHELGVPLFERTRQGMSPTEGGRVLVEHARRAIRELERARTEIAPATGQLHGQVAVGLLPSIADPLAEAIVLRTRAEHPEVRVRVVTGYAGHLAAWLDSAEIDVALLYDVRPAVAVDVDELVEEPLWAVGPAGCGLEAAAPVSLHQLAQHLFVLPSAPHAVRNMVDRAAASIGRSLDIVTETNSMSVQRRLVLAGVGHTVLPVSAVAEELVAGRLSAAPLTDPALRRRLVLAVPTARRLGPAVRMVTSVLRDAVEEAASTDAWPLAVWIGGPGSRAEPAKLTDPSPVRTLSTDS